MSLSLPSKRSDLDVGLRINNSLTGCCHSLEREKVVPNERLER